jgi:predicted alpha/beta-fold hydrolase
MHFRGCGSRTNDSLRSYHAGETEDASFFIDTLKQDFPQARLHAIGYSLGGNMLLKLVSTYSEDSPLDSAVAVSTPLELETCTLHLSKGFAKLYQYYLLKDLKTHLLQKAHKLDLLTPLGLSIQRIKDIKSIYEFDDIYTAPVHGFSDAHEYYTRNSSRQFLSEIKMPTLMIHAQDDPFMPSSVFPKVHELSKSIQFELYENGGHVGFIEGSLLQPRFWLQKRIQSFIESV